jgi:hypothetical protein
MGTITPEELLTAWKLEQVSVEMAIGHILQNLVKQQTAFDAHNRMLLNLRADVDRLIVQTGLTPTDKGKKKPNQAS